MNIKRLVSIACIAITVVWAALVTIGAVGAVFIVVALAR